MGAALAVLLNAPTALADGYEAALTRAVAAKERALEANDPSRWEETLGLFMRARSLRDTSEANYEIGVAAARLQRDDLAAEAYGAAIRLGLGSGPRQKAEAFLAERWSQMAHIELWAPGAATVWVNGFQRGTTPLGRDLIVFPGDVVLLVILPSGERVERRLDLAPDDREVVRVEAAPLSLPGAPAAAVTPSASSTVPATTAKPPRPTSAPAQTTPAQTTPREADPPVTTGSSGSSAAGISLIIVGATVGVAGGVMVPVSGSRIADGRSDLRAYCQVRDGSDACAHPFPGREAEAQSAVDSIATWKAVRTGAWIGLGVGTVTLVVGAALLGGRSDSRPAGSAAQAAAGVSVWPGPGGAMVGYAGSF